MFRLFGAKLARFLDDAWHSQSPSAGFFCFFTFVLSGFFVFTGSSHSFHNSLYLNKQKVYSSSSAILLKDQLSTRLKRKKEYGSYAIFFLSSLLASFHSI